MPRTIDVRLEVSAVFRNAPSFSKAEDLVPAAVGEDRPVPADESMQTSHPRNQLIARTKVEVVGVAKDDLGTGLLEIFEEGPFHRALGPYRHEGGCVYDAVRRLAFAEPGASVGSQQRKTERAAQAVYYGSRLHEVEGFMGSQSTKARVGVIYGGRSGEHEVSVVSAASIFKHLDRSRFQPVPIRIDKDGRWVLGAKEPTAISAGEVQENGPGSTLQVIEPTAAIAGGIDVVFPVLHGPYGEDGTVQGLLELANVPYVGAGVLGSALGMDKAVSKTVFAAHGLPIVPYLTVTAREWETAPGQVASRVASSLRYPVFVKPANLGSSVGISRATSEGELSAAMKTALDYDRKIVIEASVPNAREIECAVLGNDEPEASLPGEIVVTHRDGFYSYEAKYLDPNGATPKIPADLTPEMIERVRRLSVDAFRALDLAGMARVDFFLDGRDGALYLNEVNTIPGFTAISMYPKMWEATGLSYPELLSRLISLAIERHEQKQRLRTSRT
jgi:D-alanine-D-alanine ligase